MTKFAIMGMVLLSRFGTAMASPPSPLDSVDTSAAVVVEAQQEKLSVLRAQMVQLQEQIYSNYNKLNTDHQYDVTCTTEVPPNSRLRRRVCLPQLVRDALYEDAQDFMGNLDGHPARTASMEVVAKREAFTKHYRQVVGTHPQLLEMDREYGELVKQYEAVRKQKFKGKIVVLD